MSSRQRSSSNGGSSAADIRASPFFVPTVVRSFVDSTLSDANFPLAQLQWLMQVDDAVAVDAANKGQAQPSHRAERLAALRNATSAPSPLRMTSAEEKALADAIGALCTDLALPAAQDDNQEAQRRCSLGFCRLLARQTVDAAAELDVTRSALYARQQRRRRRKQADNSRPTEDGGDAQHALADGALYVTTLSGAELAAELLGNTSEATRLRRWRRQAMAAT